MGKYDAMIENPKHEGQQIEQSAEHALCSPKNHFEEDKQKYGSTDPRSDKAVDHKYWEDLLWNAWQINTTLSSLYYLLHGIRCGGGELTMTRDSFRLLRGEWSEEEWADIRKENLDPVKETLIRILKMTRVEGRVKIEVPEEWLNGETAAQQQHKSEEQGRLFE